MKYRREVDGLRTIAVVPVILFHADLHIFSGGFVGVDVFFVISGFLITSILLGELEQGDFSITRFYERRARRILPALVVVMLACLPFAWMWMFPNQLRDFSQSLVAVTLFVSNILFWKEDGYFAAAAELKPLLHTWSLAVEEQYYLVFPVFLAVLWRFGRRSVFWMTCAIALASLLLSEWGSRAAPSANFYLAPFRAWELLVGSLTAFLTTSSRYGDRLRQGNGWLAGAGLLLVLLSIFVFDENTPFPGRYALAPVVGTALVLAFARTGTLTAQLLSIRPFVGIGLISYSAYLWHQPLFAFARIRSLQEPPLALMLGLSVLSLLLAWGSWKWIEAPFRKSGASVLPTRGQVFMASGLAGAVIAAIGVSGHVGDGFEGRFDDRVYAALRVSYADSSGCHNGLEVDDIRAGQDCRIGAGDVEPTLALLGDSHMGAVTDALSQELEQAGLAAATYNGSWCVPLRNFATNTARKNRCLDKVNAALDQVMASPGLETVVLFAEWAAYTEGYRWPQKVAAAYIYDEDGELDYGRARQADNATYFAMALDRTLSELEQAGKTVIIILPVPEHDLEVPHAVARSRALQVDSSELDLSMDAYLRRTGPVREILFEQGKKAGARFIDPAALYCGAHGCPIVTPRAEPMYIDGNHLSLDGARELVEALMVSVGSSS